MRTVPERPVLATFGVMVVALFSGPFLGLVLGRQVAADSDLAQAVTVLAFPIAFFLGLLFWMGLGIVKMVFTAIRILLGGRLPASADTDKSETLVPPGYGSFVVVSIIATAGAGLVTAMASEATAAVTLPVYVLAGAGYGGALWWLAHSGYLPFPEPA